MNASADDRPHLCAVVVTGIGEARSVTGPILVGAALFGADAGLGARHSYVIGPVGENIVHDIRRTLASPRQPGRRKGRARPSAHPSRAAVRSAATTAVVVGFVVSV